MHEPLEMIAAYFEGKLNETQIAELEAYLREDRDRAKAFVRQAMLDCHLTELLHEQNVQDVATDLSDDSQFGAMLNSTATPATASSSDDLPPIHLDAGKLTKEKYVSALTYVLKHTFTPRRVATLATAAALLLGVVLATVLLTGPDDADTDSIADLDLRDDADTTQPDDPPPSPPTVATLTNTHNAAWAEGALAPGSKLHPNTRHTLTAGFAEITTQRGAVAILEAPATIEFSNNNNAIHLHTGKLVGICETESSKGFVVRTPHMDVTDLGTTFGVAADGHASTVSVFQGRVQAVQSGSQPDNTEANPLLLFRNEAALAEFGKGVQRLTNTSATNQQFASLLSEIFSLQARVHGDIRILYHPPASIDRGPLADPQFMQLFRERSGVALNDALQIDRASTGGFNSYHIEVQPQTRPGERVTSYMLFASRAGDSRVQGAEQADITHLSGSITFEGQIVGLIGRSESLQESDAHLGLPEVDYGSHIARGILNEKAAFVDDWIEISEDRKTLTIDCKFVGIDQLRILVEHP